MKRLLTVLLSALLIVACVFSLTACSDGGSEGDGKTGLLIKKVGNVYNIYDYVDDGTLTDGVLDIASILKEKNIESARIKKGTFDGVTTIKTLIVPDSVIEIEEGAFKNMSGLVTLEVPFVGKNAKADAYQNQTPAAVNKAVNREKTFAHFFGTTEYSGGTTLIDIYGETYYVPTKLKTVKINATDKVKYGVGTLKEEAYSIPEKAFSGVITLQNVELVGVNINEIGENAFKDCKGLTSITIPSTVKNIYTNAFSGCSNLTSVEILGDNVNLYAGAFEGCTSIDKIATETGATINVGKFNQIGKNAFNFGNSKEYNVLNKGSFDLASIFGETKIK